MASMRELADHVIAVAERSGRSITNLQLQKVLFFIFGRMISQHGVDSEIVRQTYDRPFRRWSYGPVVESLYFDYNHFGGRPISAQTEENEEYSEYNADIVHLLDVDPFYLVEVTHKLPSWANYKEDINQRNYVPPYENKDLVREFRNDN